MRVLRIIKNGFKYIFDARYRFIINDGKNLYVKMSDKEYTEKKFENILGYTLNLDNLDSLLKKNRKKHLTKNYNGLSCMIINQNIQLWLINIRLKNMSLI